MLICLFELGYANFQCYGYPFTCLLKYFKGTISFSLTFLLSLTHLELDVSNFGRAYKVSTRSAHQNSPTKFCLTGFMKQLFELINKQLCKQWTLDWFWVRLWLIFDNLTIGLVANYMVWSMWVYVSVSPLQKYLNHHGPCFLVEWNPLVSLSRVLRLIHA